MTKRAGTCKKCGGPCGGRAVHCRGCRPYNTATTKGAGWARAQARFTLGGCERCGAPAKDRHHKDGNMFNNDPSNVAILCRRCHMLADGRIKHSGGIPSYLATGHPPVACIECGRSYKPLRRRLCSGCYSRARKRGTRQQFKLSRKVDMGELLIGLQIEVAEVTQ